MVIPLYMQFSTPKAPFANGNNTNDTDGVILIVMLIVLGV